MRTLIKFLLPYFWFLEPKKILFEGEGVYSRVKVSKKGNWISLFTGGNYLQTYYNIKYCLLGNVFDWYLVAPWFSGTFKGKLESLLILGLGGGSQVKYYNHFYEVGKIVGIEIDPLIVDIGKKYFDLNDSTLTTVNDDANVFMDSCSEHFQLIILDLYKENVFAEIGKSSTFLKKISTNLTADGVLLINRVASDNTRNSMFEELRDIFKYVVVLHIHKSVFYIATNSDFAPKGIDDVRKLFKNAEDFNRNLNFFNALSKGAIEVN